MPIRKLDKYTIEQIAAGEVIESPFSIVKELVENSIDAGARNITVEIRNGGKTYIRVTDDGYGIAKEDFKLAFEKHTTSKILNFEDLYSIYSLGFRGEALSTIVSVANVNAISKTNNSNIGSKLEFKNNEVKETSIATNTGTSIEVFDLFANLPVRKKFLKSNITESNSITKLMYSFALGYSNIAFKYIKDDRLEFKTLQNEPLDIRISNLLDNNLKNELIKINSSNEIYTITGFISSANYYRGSRSLQYLYVNSRLVDSNLIINTIENQYRSYIPNGRFPALFLFIKTNPKNLDINIHPNKRTVKFIYEDELINLLEKSVYESISSNVYPNKIAINDVEDKSILDFNDYTNLLEKYKNSFSVKETNPPYEDKDFFEEKDENSKDNFFENLDNDEPSYEAINVDFNKDISYSYLTSIFGRYSLFQSSKERIIIVDNRRADEAIRFDKFVKDFESGKISQQLLLEPFIVNLKADDKIKFTEKREYLLNMGFDIDLISEDQVIIRSIPQIFDKVESEKFFYDILDIDFKKDEEIFYKSIRKFIKSQSFRKGFDLGETEANKYIEDLFKLDNPYKTFDGKAIILELSSEDLEKYFER